MAGLELGRLMGENSLVFSSLEFLFRFLPVFLIAFYLTRLHKYGVALDNRSTETSAPFMMWTATLGGKTAVRACGVAIADMLANAPDRVPFPTVYDAVSAEATDFANAAVGGVWMPIYAGYAIGKKGFLKPL